MEKCALWEHRRKQGLSGAALAGLLGISPTWLSRIERGHYSPPKNIRRDCARILDVEEDVLFPDGNKPSSEPQLEVKIEYFEFQKSREAINFIIGYRCKNSFRQMVKINYELLDQLISKLETIRSEEKAKAVLDPHIDGLSMKQK